MYNTRILVFDCNKVPNIHKFKSVSIKYLRTLYSFALKKSRTEVDMT